MIDEINIIRLVLYNKEYRNTTFEHIAHYLFHDTHCAEIYELLMKYQMKFNTFPENNVEIIIRDNPWKQSAENIQKKLEIVKVNDVSEYTKVDLEPIYQQTEEWIKTRLFGYMLSQGVEMYQNKIPINHKKIQELLNKAQNFSFKETKWIDVYDDEYMINLLMQETPRLKFEWEYFNKVLNGGIKKKSLNIIQGGTHMGKSRLMFSMATNIRKASKNNNVLYITLEIMKEDFALFSDMHLLQMKEDEIREIVHRDPKKYKEIRMSMKENYGKLFIVEMSGNSCTPNTIRNLVDEFQSKGIMLSAVFVDYIGIIRPQKRYDGLYEKGFENSIDIRAISQDYEIPFFSATQPDREGNRKNLKGTGADMMNVAESKAIPDTADLYMNIIQTIEMYKNNQQVLFILKNRHSGRVYEKLILDVKKGFYLVDIVGLEEETKELEEEKKDSKDEDSTDFGFKDWDFSTPAK